MPVQMLVRRGTAAAWTAANPTLAAGEIGYETDTRQAKVGDGSTAWSSLGYLTQGVQGAPGVGLAGSFLPDDDGFGPVDSLSVRPSTPFPQSEFLLAPAILTADSGTQTSTTEAIVSPQLTIPAGFVRIGTTFEMKFECTVAQGAVAQTTPGAVWRLRWGGLAGTIIAAIAAANTIITPATSVAAVSARISAFLTVKTLGAAGTVRGAFQVQDNRLQSAGAGGTLPERVQSAGGIADVTVNTTTANILCMTCQATAADAAFITIGRMGLARLVAY